MRKLTKKTLTELAEKMPVLNEYQQQAYIGGYDDHDCWWRCIAYLKSCGQDFDADAAMRLASGYYGEAFDENNYAFSGNRTELQDFADNFFSGLDGNYCSGQIVVFNPNTVSGWEGDGTSYHAVVVQGYDESGIHLFDPVSRTTFTISSWDEISQGYIINVR